MLVRRQARGAFSLVVCENPAEPDFRKSRETSIPQVI